MIFRKFVQLLASHGEKLLWFAIVAFITAATLSSLASPAVSSFDRVATGVSKTAACLMTLDSPASIQGGDALSTAARRVTWLVSLSGWLLIPTLIGALLSHQQEFDADKRSMKFMAKQCAEEIGVDKEVFVELLMNEIDKFVRERLPDKKGD